MRFIVALVFLLAQSLLLQAQQQLGVSSMQYAPTRQMQLNPAAIGYNRDHRLVIDVAGVQLNGDNSTARIQTNSFTKVAFDSIDLDKLFTFNEKDKVTGFAEIVVNGPGGVFHINKHHSIGLSTRTRVMGNITDISRAFGNSLRNITISVDSPLVISSERFYAGANGWLDFGFSYAYTNEVDEHQTVYVGATFHYLRGIGFFEFNNHNLNLAYQPRPDTAVVLTNTDIAIRSTERYRDNFQPENLFSGVGFGLDLGAVYEYRRSKNEPYQVRLSVSALDLGSLRYGSGAFTAYLRGNGRFRVAEVNDSLGNFTNAKQFLNNHGISVDTTAANISLPLPARLVVGADYHLAKNIYLNGTAILNLISRSTAGNHYQSVLSLTPRFEKKLYGASVPLSLDLATGHFRVGLALRFSGFYIGSDSPLIFFGDQSQYGGSLYAGGFVPLGYRKTRGVFPKSNTVL